MRGFLLNRQIPFSVTKVICQQSLRTFDTYFWIEAKMQYNCLYRQVTYLNRIINLTITKWTTKIKKQKDTVNNLCKYWLCYLFKLLTFQTSFENSFQTKNKFQISSCENFLQSFCRTKNKVKREERNDENNCLIGFLRGQLLDSKVKTRGTALNIIIGK